MNTIGIITRTAAIAVLLVAGPRAARAATRYDGDGYMSPRLETERWYINRARFAPEYEADRFGLVNTNAGGHPDYDTCEDSDGTNDFGTTPAQWEPWRRSKPPLAPNYRMSAASSNHCRDMAETGVFSHNSPSANYYPLGSTPSQRVRAEGYTNQVTGFYENIASGTRLSTGGYPSYGRLPENVHEGLFVDTNSTPNRGHRRAILNDNAREIGLGHARTNWAQDYDWGGGTILYTYFTKDYDTQDFGRTGSNHFFTGTIFHDADTNGVYAEGEGIGGVEVRLWDGEGEALWYDASQDSGSFAIPINDLPDGHEISVQLVNTGAAPVEVSIPLSYHTLGVATLDGGGSCILGTYVQPNGLTNAGFRNMEPRVCHTQIRCVGTNMEVAFSSLGRVTYGIESLDPGGSWTNFAQVTATNGSTAVTDCGQGGRCAPSAASVRWYRVILQRD